MANKKYLIFEDTDEEGDLWVVTYSLSSEEYDDSFEDNTRREVQFVAVDFETAVRYAQQYLRKMQLEEDTATEWASAVITSVELY